MKSKNICDTMADNLALGFLSASSPTMVRV